MTNSFYFDESKYTIETVEMESRTLVYRAFEQIPYVANPADEIQKLSMFVPETYYEGGSINGYSLKTAPIFLPNTVGGYLPGPQERPGLALYLEKPNAAFYALLHGYVVVSPGLRGRGMKNKAGENIGMAPAGILDYKAAVRYLHYNTGRIPGNTRHIISDGTSAGGAMSALLATTANHPDYDPYLQKMGALNASDQIFAASCYCPITNLEHADAAYEWEFFGHLDYHTAKFIPPAKGEHIPTIIPVEGMLTEHQQAISAELKKEFIAYLNRLELKDEKGTLLTLDDNGKGPFLDYIAEMIMQSAQKAFNDGADLSKFDWLTVLNGTVTDIDFPEYISYRTRMKPVPAFDSLDADYPENEVFAGADVPYRHFTDTGCRNGTNCPKAEEMQIKMMNPMRYIEDSRAQKAYHFRIRHGAIDRDTSLAVSAMLTLKLQNQGIDAGHDYPWETAHSGDYDLIELFAWIDQICKE